MPDKRILQIKNLGRKKRLSRDHNWVWILKDLDLDILEGERLGLIGISGSGKTTLLRIMADLESFDEGEILFKGKPIQEYSPVEYRKKIGFVHQKPTLFEGTVEYNLRYSSNLDGREMSPKEIDRLLESVGLHSQIAEAGINTLSMGQAQRVSIARALSAKPVMLVMDEPTSALDPSSTRKISNLIRRLSEDLSITIVIVLHDMSLARESSDRVALLENGKIADIDTTEEFFRRHNEIKSNIWSEKGKKED